MIRGFKVSFCKFKDFSPDDTAPASFIRTGKHYSFGRNITQVSSTVIVRPQKGPRWPTSSWYGSPCVVPFHILPDCSVWPTKQSSHNCDLTAVYISVPLLCLSCITFSRGSHARSIPREKSTHWGSKTSCQWPRKWAWKSIHPSAPVEPSGDYSPIWQHDCNCMRHSEPEPLS